MATPPDDLDPVERIKRYLDEHADEIRALEYGRIVFDIHHRRARRGRIERSDEFGDDLPRSA